jgi:hypothetical protein
MFGSVAFPVFSHAPMQHQFIPQSTQLGRHDGAMHDLQCVNYPSPHARQRKIASAARTMRCGRIAPMDVKQGHGHFPVSGEGAG